SRPKTASGCLGFLDEKQQFCLTGTYRSGIIYSVVRQSWTAISGGVAQLGACKIKSMPPMSNQQSTTSYRVPYKLPFLEEYGGIAQLGERLNGIQEVSGSIPLISTKGYAKRLVFVRKQAFSLFCDEIGISLPAQALSKGGV